ncbi:putative gustatory receptor [Trypoxylus dichotomus]
MINLRKVLSPLEFLVSIIPTFVKNLYVSQFIVYVFLLYLEFKNLNDELVKIQLADGKDNSATKQRMVCIRQRHELLCLSGKCFNRGFSAQILLIIALDFVVFVVNLYFWYVKFVDEHFKRGTGYVIHTTALGIFSLYVLAHIVTVSGVCALTKKEAARSLDLCLKIGFLHDRNVSNEINLFVQQIEHWDFGFDAMEFFKIDFTLIYSIIRSATMFLLIFIQLDGTN